MLAPSYFSKVAVGQLQEPNFKSKGQNGPKHFRSMLWLCPYPTKTPGNLPTSDSERHATQCAFSALQNRVLPHQSAPVRRIPLRKIKIMFQPCAPQINQPIAFGTDCVYEPQSPFFRLRWISITTWRSLAARFPVRPLR